MRTRVCFVGPTKPPFPRGKEEEEEEEEASSSEEEEPPRRRRRHRHRDTRTFAQVRADDEPFYAFLRANFY